MALVTSAAASLKNTWGFSPQSIPGLALWLDGADRSSMVFSGTSTTITRWNDKSGNGLHGTATGTPTYTANALNGLGAPALNSNANFFTTPTFIISPTVGTPSIFMIMNQTAYSGSGNSDFFSASDWQRIDFLGQGGAFNAAATMNGGAQTPINATTTSNNPTLLSFVVNTASGGVGFANGTFTATSGSSGGRLLSTDTYLIGGGPGFIGFIYELIVFNNTVSTSQRQQVEGYLAAKWGLKANLPVTHPYTTIIPFNRPFYPSDISGCRLWLDAADQSSMVLSGTGGVTQWKDKSGAGFNMNGTVGSGGTTIPSYSAATESSPPGVVLCSRGTTNRNFFGPSNWYAALTVPTGTHCLIAVHNPASTTVSPGNSSLFRFQATGATAATAIVFPQYLNNTPGTMVYNNNQGTGTINYNNSVLFENSTAGSLNLITANIAPTSQFVYKNGVQQSTYTSTITNVTSDNFSIGCQNWTNINGQQYDFYSGTIHEMLVFNTTLTTQQRQQVEGYLAWKWGLNSSLPAGHPGKLLPAFSTSFTVKSIPGCQLWLDAADSSTITGTSPITAWNDKSGNGNNGTATGSPTLAQNSINGRQAVTAAVGTYFLGPLAISGPSLTCFAIATTNVTLPNIRSPRADQRLVSLANGANPDYDGTGGVIPLFNWDNTSIIGAYDNNLGNVNSNTIVTGTPFMAASRFDGTTASLWFNGAPGSFPSSADNHSFSITKYGIGTQANPTIEYWSGFIGEIILFSTALTTAQRQQVEGYLAWKWGLQSSLPSTHAYAKFSP